MSDYTVELDNLCDIAQLIGNDRLYSAGKFLKQRFRNPEHYVVCLGETSSGKTTLINSLIGEKILPVSAIPTTGAIAEISFEQDISEKEFYAINKNATMEVLSEEQIVELATHPDKELSRLRVCIPTEERMSGIHLFDTPGYGSLIEEHEEVLLDFLPSCDVILYVVSYRSGIKENDYSFLETMSNLTREGIPFCLIINRCPANIQKECDSRIREIKQYAEGILEIKDIPTILIETFDTNSNELNRSSVGDIKSFILSCVQSDENQRILQQSLEQNLQALCEELIGDIDKKLAIAKLDETDREAVIAVHKEFVGNINRAIEDIVIPKFDSLIERFPQQVDYCSEELERVCVEEIKAQKKLDKDEAKAFINQYLINRNGQKQAKELQLFIKTEIEAIDREVNDYINESVIRIENDLKIRNVNEAARTAFGILTDVAGKGLERGLIGYCAKFGGQGGSGAGMANLASHVLKKIGDTWGKTFSLSTHNALKHTMSKIGLTSTRTLSCAVAVIIDGLVYIADMTTWKMRLCAAIKKVVKKWNDDVEGITTNDLQLLKDENVNNLREFITIAEAEFPEYTVDNKETIDELTELREKIDDMRRRMPV